MAAILGQDGSVNPVDRAVRGWQRGLMSARRRLRAFDHFWRAKDRYGEVHGGRLAAAISYYGFFAAFALALLGFSILGYVLNSNPTVVHAVETWLKQNLPFLNVAQIQGARQAIGVAAFVGFILTGIGWVEGMRSSIRAIWLLDQQPGNFFVRRGIDLLVLAGLGLLIGAMIGFSVGAQEGLKWLGDHLGTRGTIVGVLLSAGYVLIAVFINWILAAALLTGLPRLRMPLGRWLPASLLVAVGLEILKTLGQWYIGRTQRNPAYQVVAGAVGLLVFLNLFSQLLLWGAAIAATSHRGAVRDLAAGPRVGPEVDLPDG